MTGDNGQAEDLFIARYDVQGKVVKIGRDQMLSVCVLLYRAKKLGPGQYLDRSETGAAVPADLTQHPALPVSLKPLFPLITIYRHDVEYLKFSYLNDIFRFEVSGSPSLTGDNSQAKDVIIAGYDVQGFLGVRPAGQVVLPGRQFS